MEPVRYFLPIFGLVLLVAALAGIKYSQISQLIAFGTAAAAAGPPPEAVSTATAQQLAWEGTLGAVGSVVAERGVAVSNDAPGLVTRIRFESGDTVRPGQVLLELDTGVERAQLASAEARRELARQTAQRTRTLFQSNTVTTAKLEADDAQLKAAETDVEAIRAQIDRKTVRAPFAGRLGIRQVNLGQYLSPGTPITTLESLDSVFVDFTLPQQALSAVKPGLAVRLKASGETPLETKGTVAAVDPAINATTRSIDVRASVPNPEQKLRPGMFVDVSVVLPERGSIVAIPQTAVVHASYGDSVFVAEPLKEGEKGTTPGANVKSARQQFVKLGEARGDFIAVLDGVKVGQEVVTAGAFKLRNGAKIAIDNRVQSKPEVAPKVPNR
jgi:membrane fusion protein, multidrug efflux system